MNLMGTFLYIRRFPSVVFPVRNVPGNRDKGDRPVLFLPSPLRGEGPAAFGKPMATDGEVGVPPKLKLRQAN